MNEQIEELLTRGVAEVIDKSHLEQALKGKKKLRVKLGIDPTSPNIHIGRAVVLWKLRQFQELGHKVVFIVGDFTGLVGDTSDKEAERPMMTPAQAKANLKTYFQQAAKIIDPKKAEMYYNSAWLKKLGFIEIAEMANLFGLHDIESRENISKRLKAGKRVSFRELMYPLMQGYDSVAVKADVELGGTDQRYNLLAGRSIQPLYNQPPQDILMTVLMEGTDGRKMSSSWGNVINLTDEPGDMFGKVMSINDSFIRKYFLLATRVTTKEINEIMGFPNPRDQKFILAEKVVSLYHGEKKAAAAKLAFTAQFAKGQLPDEIPVKYLPSSAFPQTSSEILAMSGLASSKSDARRLIKQGGVKVDGRVLFEDVVFENLDAPKLFQVGKRKFLKLEKK